MPAEYTLEKVTTETFIASCKKCAKPFRSDDKQKAIIKVTSHYRDKHR